MRLHRAIFRWGAAQSQPTLNFSGGTVDPRILYTRGGAVDGVGAPTPSASYFDVSGNVVLVDRHMPRVDYDPNTHAVKGLLLEPSVTNKMLQAVGMSGGSWGLSNMTRVANDTTAPDGTATANRLVCANLTGTMSCQESATVTTGQVHEELVLAKYNSGIQWVYLNLFDGSSHNCWFDIQNGILGSVDAGVTASITALPSGWYALRAKWSPSGTPGYVSLRFASANSATTFVGDGVKSMWVWFGGLMQEDSGLTDSLIPTPTVAPIAVTRAADVAKIVLTSTAPLIFTFDDNSTQSVTPGASGLYTLPTVPTLNRHCVKKIAGSGIASATKKIVVVGDSIAAGFLASKPFWATAIEGCWIDHSVVAANSIHAYDGIGFLNSYNGKPAANSDIASINALYDSRYENWLVVFLGTNDIWLDGKTDVEVYNAFSTTFWNGVTTSGTGPFAPSHVAVVTMLPRQSDATNETRRLNLNIAYRGGAATLGFKLADVALDATIGVAGSQNNGTYYAPDLIHPIDAGHALIGPYVEAAIFS